MCVISDTFLKQAEVWAGQGGSCWSSNPPLFEVSLFPYVSAGMLNRVRLVQKVSCYLKCIGVFLARLVFCSHQYFLLDFLFYCLGVDSQD